LNPGIKKVLKFVLFLGIGLGLVYLSVKDIINSPQNREDIKNALSNAHYSWIGLAMLAGVLSHLVRAMRWGMLIEPFYKKPQLKNAFFSVIIGYFANYAPLPRLGEVYRCVILNRYEKTPFTELVGTIVVERALDFLMMGIFLVVMLLLRAEKVYSVVMAKGQSYFHDKIIWFQSHIIIIAAALLIVFAALYFILKRQKTFLEAVKKFLLGFWIGIKGVAKLKSPLLFCFYTIAIWVLYLLAAYFCFFCFDGSSGLTLADGFVVLIFGAVGVIVSPGGTGAYQVLVSKAFIYIYHFTNALAIALAWVLWGSQFILIVTLGLISLVLIPILNKNEEAGDNTVKNS
jgi:uncharacterized protein (TIRG00374 family)